MAVVSNGTTLIDNGALDSGVPTGSLILLSTQTASASASISFTSGLDSTYDSYVFKFINMHPSSDAVYFQFNMSTDGGSNYNVTKTTTFFISELSEGGSGGLYYWAPGDLAQSTSYQYLNYQTGNASDESLSGELFLFNPSSTTFIKNFLARTQHYAYNNYTQDVQSAGYGNTTSAVNAIDFEFSSGNIDSGTIKLYGVK